MLRIYVFLRFPYGVDMAYGFSDNGSCFSFHYFFLIDSPNIVLFFAKH